MQQWRASVALGLALLFTASRAQAYVDPGSGALVWQAILAGFFGAIFYFLTPVRLLKSWLRQTGKRVRNAPR